MKLREKKRRAMQSASTKGRVVIDEDGKPILMQRMSKQKGYLIKELAR